MGASGKAGSGGNTSQYANTKDRVNQYIRTHKNLAPDVVWGATEIIK